MTTLGTVSRRPIAVVGATGLQGGATVRALLGANVPDRALARRTDSDAARALTELGADLVVADLDDPDGLRAAFTGVDGVFAMTTPGYELRIDLEVRHGHAIAVLNMRPLWLGCIDYRASSHPGADLGIVAPAAVADRQ